MPVRKDKNPDFCTPTCLALRWLPGDLTAAELVITDNGVTVVHHLTEGHVRLLARKAVEFISR